MVKGWCLTHCHGVHGGRAIWRPNLSHQSQKQEKSGYDTAYDKIVISFLHLLCPLLFSYSWVNKLIQNIHNKVDDYHHRSDIEYHCLYYGVISGGDGAD